MPASINRVRQSSPAAGLTRPLPVTSSRVTGTLVLLLRIVRWTLYVGVLVTLILLLHKSAPPPVAATPEAAAQVEKKFQDVQQAVSQGQTATLRMNETELNSYLASRLEVGDGENDEAADSNDLTGTDPRAASATNQGRSNVRDVRVQLVQDRVKAYVVFDVHGKDMTLRLEGKLGADNGFLTFEPVSGQIGALPIPQATLEAAVRKLMESPESREKLRLPDDVSDLKVENGEIVAEYQ